MLPELTNLENETFGQIAHYHKRIIILVISNNIKIPQVLMSWRSAWKKIKKGVKKAAKAIEQGVNQAGNYIGSASEWIGDKIDDALHDAGKWVQRKFGGSRFGKVLNAIINWIGDLAKAGFDFGGAVIKGIFGIVGGVVGGIIEIIGGIVIGIFTWGDFGLLKDGLIDIVSSIFGAVIVVVFKGLEALQSIVFGFFERTSERRLTKLEEEQLKLVFKDSIYYYLVRIIEGEAGFFRYPKGRALTIGNTIYLKNEHPSLSLIVHECTHVWQYQNIGSRYTADAARAQWSNKDQEEYHWWKDVPQTIWSDLNVEAQAQFIQDAYDFGYFNKTSPHYGVFIDDRVNSSNKDITWYLEATLVWIRGLQTTSS